MKKIRFTEARRLLDTSVVKKGEIREIEDREADAFVRNGVAEHIYTQEEGENG